MRVFFNNLINYTSPLFRNSSSLINLKTGIVGLSVVSMVAAYFGYQNLRRNHMTMRYLFDKEEYNNFVRSRDCIELGENPDLISHLREKHLLSNSCYHRPVSFASENLMKNLFEEHVPAESKILELGSGFLYPLIPIDWLKYQRSQDEVDAYRAEVIENNIAVSELGELMPSEHLRNITYSDSDAIKKAKVGEEAILKNQYLQYYPTEGPLIDPKTKQTMTQDVIIAQNIANLVKRSELKDVADAAYETLNSDGKVILFTTSPPSLGVFFTNFSNDQIVFPSLSEPRGLIEVSKKTLEKKIKQLNVDDKKFISNILQLNPAQRSLYFLTMIKSNLTIIEFFNNFTSNIGKFHDRIISYEEDVKTAFGNRFTVLECGDRVQTTTIKKRDFRSKYGYDRGDENHIILDYKEQSQIYKVDPTLDADELKQESRIHVIVLQKKESPIE